MTTSQKPIADAYPLAWPAGRERATSRESALFDTSFAKARDNIIKEVTLLCGRFPDPMIVISTNVPLRRDGYPYAGMRQPDDTGVAVYFVYKEQQMSFACDRWQKIEDNMQAISKTIEALRGIARWGTGDMLRAAFTGFAALPPPDAFDWRAALGIAPGSNFAQAERAYKTLRSFTHPDKGGSAVQFARVQRAWEIAQRELRT